MPHEGAFFAQRLPVARGIGGEAAGKRTDLISQFIALINIARTKRLDGKSEAIGVLALMPGDGRA